MNNILGHHDPLSVWHCNKWSIDYLQPNRSPWRAPKRGFEWYSGVKCGWWMLIGQLFLSVWQPNTKLIFWLFGPKMYLYALSKKGAWIIFPECSGASENKCGFKCKQVETSVSTQVQTSGNKCVYSSANKRGFKYKQVWLLECFLGGPGRPPSLSVW